jgi:hypothetical protein
MGLINKGCLMRNSLLVMLIVLSGCAYSIAKIDITKAEPACVRECSKTYSQCASGGSAVGFKTETLRACGEAYQICIQTCPLK